MSNWKWLHSQGYGAASLRDSWTLPTIGGSVHRTQNTSTAGSAWLISIVLIYETEMPFDVNALDLCILKGYQRVKSPGAILSLEPPQPIERKACVISAGEHSAHLLLTQLETESSEASSYACHSYLLSERAMGFNLRAAWSCPLATDPKADQHSPGAGWVVWKRLRSGS